MSLLLELNVKTKIEHLLYWIAQSVAALLGIPQFETAFHKQVGAIGVHTHRIQSVFFQKFVSDAVSNLYRFQPQEGSVAHPPVGSLGIVGTYVLIQARPE